MNAKLEEKLKNLPKTPGVYFYKDKSGEIIYIGKAAVLRNRVRQYFQKSRAFDPKTDALVAEIADVDWLELETEMDALFVEAEMIRRYMPKYNILLRDDKSFVYVRIDSKSDYPYVSFTRRPLDDGADYYGPFLSKFIISRALKYLRRVFPYSTHAPTNIPKRACLQAQIGLCPGLEAGMTSLKDYRKNLSMLAKYITGKRKTIISDIEKQMKAAAKAKDYEEAARLRNKLFALKKLDTQIIFGDRESMDISKDHGLVELAELLKLYVQPGDTHVGGVQGVGEKRTESYKSTAKGVSQPRTQQSTTSSSGAAGFAGRQGRALRIPRRIEGFDISHMQGTDTVASMVVFVAGVPAKSEYRKFKSRIKGNDDFAHMREVMSRRFSETNIKKWGKPDLILIDGGKGQVSSAHGIIKELELSIPLIGLAKKYEEIIVPKDAEFETVLLPRSSDALKLLQRVRDESHRFAVSYHSTLKRGRQNVSILDSIPGIGDVYKKKLIRTFGSARGVQNASFEDLKSAVGEKRAQLIKQHMAPAS
jgi:excinuclease ABC subunit C